MFNQPKNDDLNDSIADLIGGVDETKAANPVQPPADYTPGTGRPNKFKDARLYTETCHKCNGSGLYRAPSSHGHRCFECDGVGSKTFKTSPEARKAKRTQKSNRNAAVLAEAIAATTAAHPVVVAWIRDKAANGNGFAASLLNGLNQYGDLSVGKVASVERAIQQDAERVVEAAKRIENAPVADAAGVDRLKLAFDTAIAYSAAKGLKKSPKITVGPLVISPAKAASKNPGALYVKDAGQYLGKIANGRFYAARECSDKQQADVLKFVADPKAAAEVYGKETGTCCVCNATLTSEWKLRGIGPICAEKFGW